MYSWVLRFMSLQDHFWKCLKMGVKQMSLLSSIRTEHDPGNYRLISLTPKPGKGDGASKFWKPFPLIWRTWKLSGVISMDSPMRNNAWSTWSGWIEPGTFQWCPLPEQQAVSTNWNTWSSPKHQEALAQAVQSPPWRSPEVTWCGPGALPCLSLVAQG